jgi:transposase-like protein
VGRRGYPPEFRRRVLVSLLGGAPPWASGRKVSEVAFDLKISEQTIYSCLRQDRIDRHRARGELAIKSGPVGDGPMPILNPRRRGLPRLRIPRHPFAAVSG